MGESLQQETYGSPTLGPAILVGGLFSGGMALGVGAAMLFAPTSLFALLVGFMALPISFGLGMSLWYNVANLEMIRKAFRALFRSLKTRDLQKSVRDEFLAYFAGPVSGTRVFVPVTVVITFSAGVVVACCPDAQDVELVVSGFTCLGLGYALLVTWLARQGFLPQPHHQ
jgi:hypothetical protein